MPVDIIVCAKQVIDPETPSSASKIDPASKRVVPAPGIPPVVNGFDENAVEAALIINEAVGANITVLSVGSDFAIDVMKKPLSMGTERVSSHTVSPTLLSSRIRKVISRVSSTGAPSMSMSRPWCVYWVGTAPTGRGTARRPVHKRRLRFMVRAFDRAWGV